METPLQFYDQQYMMYTELLGKARINGNRVAMLRLFTALTAIISGFSAGKHSGSWSWWLTGVLILTFLILVQIHMRISERKRVCELYLSILENEQKAMSGDVSPFYDGSAYINVSHAYSYDLDIFGKGSIYQMLCRAATTGGRRELAQRLMHIALKKEVITERQQIITELAGKPELLLSFRVAGILKEENPESSERLADWLRGEDRFINNPVIRVAAVLMPLSSVGLIAYSIVTGGMSSLFSIVIVVNWVLLGLFQKNIRPAINQVGHAEEFIEKIQDMLGQVAANEFNTPRLQQTAHTAKQSLVRIKKFKDRVRLFESRENVFLGPLLNSLFLFDLYCLQRLEQWRSHHSHLMLSAIDDVTTMDAYISCAVYAFNNPGHTCPQLFDTGTEISARDLRHPLLPSAIAIGNSFSLGKAEQFYLLTGANMTGKSTFMRTLGVSNVMANIGLPVPAASLTLPVLDMYTSMRITDSVLDDVSYFRAELNRIKDLMVKVKASGHPYLILLDEPLRGTNSTDKQQGTRAIVETLTTFHAAGIVATHDTGLCDMAALHPGKVSNYHFESTVTAKGLAFDFKLKTGGSTSNNATILMRQMGIIN